MPEHPHYDEDDIINPETQHEETDVNVRALIWFFVIFIIGGIVTYVGVYGLYKGLISLERTRSGPPLTAIQRPEGMSIPKNEPLLQPFPRKAGDVILPPYRTTPVTDMVEMRRQEDRILHNYGWVDKEKGLVHIPIEIAKTLVLQRGLPMQTATPGVQQ